ncbi:MAG: hypothetical protein JXR52_10780 [Bacteroidales bacterium]|nr:hypothetical protein [Bacteroidales bacterium]
MNLKLLSEWFVSASLLCVTAMVSAQPVLSFEENLSVTWQEAVESYRWLDEHYENALLTEAGKTDIGKPLHLFIISQDREFTPQEVRASGKGILFINNGIHPGEPCGIDASIKLASDLLSRSDDYHRFLENTVVVIVPVLNVGGALNRSPYHRANQNGPVEQGFRGNARNLDLNRDFIKLDSRNARSLVELIRAWEPDILVDTHTSNGADYSYVITLINNHPQRLEKSQGNLLVQTLLPFLYQSMRETPYEMIPYVWSYRETPELGIVGFMDYPRYTSGYGSLFNTLCFTVETHMFKPFSDRVLSTWHLLREMLRMTSIFKSSIRAAKLMADMDKTGKKQFVLRWEMDTLRSDTIHFKGYTAKRKPSRVTGFERLYYDRNEPWEKTIPYYNHFRPAVTVTAPDFYIIPQAWEEVIDRLEINGIELWPLREDTLLDAEVYYIDHFETGEEPYNGHYWHYNTGVRKAYESVTLLKGDRVVPVSQPGSEYIVQTLEPEGYDSFFSWNFFDAILSRKEYFSPYVFEEKAEEILAGDPILREQFETRKSRDPGFRSNPYAQLRFIYEHSEFSEKTYRRYPVYRVMNQ